jgi:TetR/AcrR family transcriptional regulator
MLKQQTDKAEAREQGAKTNARKAILDAALIVFSRDGFHGASLATIAERAHVLAPLIPYHFGSKDNLWRATVEYALGDLNREATTIKRASRGLSPLDRLSLQIRSFTHFAARYPDHFGLLCAEARPGSKRFAWIREHYTGGFLDSLRSLLEEAREAGQIRDVSLDHLSFILLGAILMFFTANEALPDDADLERIADEHADLISDMVLKSIALAPRLS